MQPRVGEMQELMERFGVHYPACPVCAADGRGNVGDLTEHIIGVNHFKALGRVCLLDNMPMREVRDTLWDAFLLPGGGVRINHADGAIEMCHGHPAVTPLTVLSPSSMLAIADRSAAAGPMRQPPMLSAPSTPSAIGLPFFDGTRDAADLPGVWNQACSIVPPIPSDGAWYRIIPRAAWPSASSGDASVYPQLQSKNTWKQHIQMSANVMGKILEHFGIYPECSVCNVHLLSFHEHVPAAKHYKALGDLFLNKSGPLEAIRNAAWQEWKNLGVDKLNLRFNHIDGETHARIGQFNGTRPPPPAMPPQVPSISELSPGVRELQMWLWQKQIGKGAEQVAAAAEMRQVCPSRLLCAVCVRPGARVHMEEGIREHLKSKRHLENLEKQLLRMQPGWSGYDAPRLEQHFQRLGLTLDHLTGVVAMDYATDELPWSEC